MSETCTLCGGRGTYEEDGIEVLCPCNPESPQHNAWLRRYGSAAEQEQRKRKDVAKSRASTLYDEMNLTEHALVDWGRGPARGGTTIIRQWTLSDGTPGGLFATTNEQIGLPTPQDLDLLQVLITISQDEKNPSKVKFRGARLMEMLMRPKGGRAYRRTRKGFRRWHSLSIHRWAGWWDKGNGERIATGGWHVLEQWHWPTRKEIREGADPQPFFRFGEPLRTSLQAGNVKYLDLDAYWSIDDPVGRFMYRYADRHLYGDCKEFSTSNENLYCSVLGLGWNEHSAEWIAKKLQQHSRELSRTGIEVEVGPYHTTFWRSGANE